jgi:hypothetical protein
VLEKTKMVSVFDFDASTPAGLRSIKPPTTPRSLKACRDEGVHPGDLRFIPRRVFERVEEEEGATDEFGNSADGASAAAEVSLFSLSGLWSLSFIYRRLFPLAELRVIAFFFLFCSLSFYFSFRTSVCCSTFISSFFFYFFFLLLLLLLLVFPIDGKERSTKSH